MTERSKESAEGIVLFCQKLSIGEKADSFGKQERELGLNPKSKIQINLFFSSTQLQPCP
jgi:hypothetical protein